MLFPNKNAIFLFRCQVCAAVLASTTLHSSVFIYTLMTLRLDGYGGYSSYANLLSTFKVWRVLPVIPVCLCVFVCVCVCICLGG
jgi:hypothetical protein